MKYNPVDPYHARYFFETGIRFECRRCGACCTGDPGIVRVSGLEIHTLAHFLKISVPDLTRLHLQKIQTGFSIAEHADGTCHFYDQGCRVYPVRPLQCRTYPFWFNRMRSLQQWKKATRECPGIGTGPLYSRDRILDILSRTMDFMTP